MLSACIEPFDFEVDKTSGTLIINGRITNSKGPHYVYINRTTAADSIRKPETGAVVTLHEEGGNTYPLFEELPGQYILPIGLMNANPGLNYHIAVNLLNGEVYESTPDRMPEVTAQDSLYVQFVLEERVNENGVTLQNYFHEAYINSRIPQTDKPLFIRWEVQETYQLFPVDLEEFNEIEPPPCYITDYPDPQRINLFNNFEFDAGTFSNLLVAKRPLNYAFKALYFTNLYQYSLSESAYTYWENIAKNINQAGSIFDTPPATVKGNIFNVNNPQEAVFGYFEAAAVKVQRVSVSDESAPIEVGERCPYDAARPNLNQYEPLCQDCNISPKSIPRPEYFP